MSRILALDSSTEACSAALLNDDRVLQRYADAPRAHTRLLLPMVDELLAEANLRLEDLDAIAFGRGPGSFTGIRIATSMAQGLAFAVDKPLLAISTLAALAQGLSEIHPQSINPDIILAAIDARMAEIYWAAYRLDADGLVSLCGEENLSPPAQINLKALSDLPDNAIIYAAGSGWEYADQIPLHCRIRKCYPALLPNAIHIARLAARDFRNGLGQTAEDALPVYLRDKVAWQNG